MQRFLTITTANSRRSTHWQPLHLMWDDFTRRIATPQRSSETYDEYIRMSKTKQDELKDVGGYVGGSFSGERRLARDLEGRDLITLDLDCIPANETDKILQTIEELNYSACVYSTRKHCSRAPRLRVILPLDRTATPDEYEPVARRICTYIGIRYADPTTFEASRVMYWPSVSKDGEYIYKVFRGAPVSVSGILATYDDWNDPLEWPQVPGFAIAQKRELGKAEDPRTKPGLIGAFCRTYSIQEAIAAYLSGVYIPTQTSDRYTYAGGSTHGGAVIYEDKFLYSHHATDPVSGRLVNAWDLVRLHKFGDLDDLAKDGTPITKLPSSEQMRIIVDNDEKVIETLKNEKAQEVIEAFGGDAEGLDWLSELDTTKKGNYESSIHNFVVIMRNDAELKNKIAIERFTNREVIKGRVPWDKEDTVYPRSFTDTDESQIYYYIEKHYAGLYSKDKAHNALNIIGDENQYNVVEDYLRSLTWDGVKRVDTLLTDYLGAEDNAYTRAAIRKTLLAAAKRACAREPVKFDPMIILIGRQGMGKSTFLRYLAKKEAWYDESLSTFEGKEAAEHIQGSWIVEIGELAAMSRKDINAVKNFQTRTTDRFRQAYGHHTTQYIRRCVFMGTTNNDEFLRDSTGNRRYWPIEVDDRQPHSKDVFKDLPDEVDQIWAEVMQLDDETLDMDTEELMRLSAAAQEAHRVTSPMEGMIAGFLDTPIPPDWYSLDRTQKAAWMSDPQNLKRKDLVLRDRICLPELWTECFGGNYRTIPREKKTEISNALKVVMDSRPEWKATKGARVGIYGVQRGYIKKR